MRVAAFLAVVLSSLLLLGSVGLAVSNRSHGRSRADQRLRNTAGDEAAKLQEYFARARSIVLITAQNPSFGAFYEAPGARVDKVRQAGRAVRELEGALAYLERLYPSSIGEACFIDRSGPENARYVRGKKATFADLSPNETKSSFFRPTFALRAGQVYQATPYVSPDTHEWVISNSTPLPGTGFPAAAIVHFEVTLASFQREAASLAREADVVIFDSTTGRAIVDSSLINAEGAPLARRADHRFAAIAARPEAAGTTTIDGHRAAFRHLERTPNNANDWTVAVVDAKPTPSLLGSGGWASFSLALAAFALLLGSLFGFRASKRALALDATSRLAELTRAAAERDYARTQREFTEVMQITRDEGESYNLLKRHLERSLVGSDVLVLNRNNSHDRLEPMTELAADSPLYVDLQTSTPDSCLAVRLGKIHEQGPDHDPLLACELCGVMNDQITCVPSLVGGEVIGSVLVRHPAPLEPQERRRVEESMTQASPVVANLRNLALSQTRALTDGLTGLPNRRAIEDSLKRMVARADRYGHPLGVVLFDLDHFKQVNDLFGHEKGDEVLSAVGAVVASTLRASDFAGRLGGEEFILLLPETDAASTLLVAEKLRVAIAEVDVTGVTRPITASLGVATMPGDGSEPAVLLRTADRALYLAKAGGRDRVEALAVESPPPTTATNGRLRRKPAAVRTTP